MATRKAPKSSKAVRGSRARADKRKPSPATPDKPDRVAHIADMMTGLQWVCGRSTRELAKKWGVSERTVEDDASEASRYVKRAVDRDPDEMRAQLVSQLQFLTQSSVKMRQPRAAIEGVKAIAGLLGLEAPKKLDVGGTLADLLPLAFGADPEPDEPKDHTPKAPDGDGSPDRP